MSREGTLDCVSSQIPNQRRRMLSLVPPDSLPDQIAAPGYSPAPLPILSSVPAPGDPASAA
jgi:hypothetical protein